MLKKICALLLTVAMLLCAAAAEGYEAVYSAANPIPEIAARVRPAVVQVTSLQQNWDAATRATSETPLGSGSGCYIRAAGDGDGGFILTNYHIIADGDLYRITWLSGEEMDVRVVGHDDGTDIAILRFDQSAPVDAQPIPVGDSDALQIGELVICIGNPGSAGNVLPGTVTAGIVSGLGREDINANNFSRSVSVIQTDAAINTGNSGGAMLNARGELVGIPTLKLMYSATAVYEGLGFCIPINGVRDFIDQIIDTGSVVRPRLGITVADIDGPDEPMRRYPPIGAQVYTVEEGGPSAKAGLQVGDVITEINGVRINGYMALLKELDKCKAGDRVELEIYRYYDAEGNLTGDYEQLFFTVRLEMLK